MVSDLQDNEANSKYTAQGNNKTNSVVILLVLKLRRENEFLWLGTGLGPD